MPSICAGSDVLGLLNTLILLTGENWPVALATVVGVQGSAPQKEGSFALFGSDGLVAGTIGGGIVEFSVQGKIHEALEKKQSAFYSFKLAGNLNEKEAAICGGSMKILLDAEPGRHIAVFEAMVDSLRQRIPGVLITLFGTNHKQETFIERKWVVKESLLSAGDYVRPEILNYMAEMLECPVHGKCRSFKLADVQPEEELNVFIQTIVPPSRLIIAGAGHIGKALSHLGKMLGFEVVVWDYRSEYATLENLPDADIILNGSVDADLSALVADSNTYIAAVTTGHGKDSEIIKAFINSPAAYIGMIGSRKKGLLMKEQFLKEGWATREQWERIHTPIGLDIDAESVEEIAVSIAAQLVQVRQKLNNEK